MLRKVKRWFSSSGNDCKYMRFWRLDEEPDEERRPVEVSIVGSGSLSHWATVWEFEGNVVRVAELTAWPVEEGGDAFEACNYLFYEIASLQSLIAEQGYTQHENPTIHLETSPAELLMKCRDHPQNGTPYHAANNNCQKWVVQLLCDLYGVLPELLPPTWIDSASVLPEPCSRAALTGVVATAGAISRFGGGLGLFLSLFDAKLAIDNLLVGTPPDGACYWVSERVARLADVYAMEPHGAAREAMMRTLAEQLEMLDIVRSKIKARHTGFNVARIGGNVMGVASGACFLAAPLAFGPAFLVAAALAAGSTLTFTGGQVYDSYFGYDLRSAILTITDSIVAARKEYAQSTGRLTEGLEGESGIFEFSVPGTKWCQFYMTILYVAPDGTLHQRLSCDQPSPSWYKNRIVIEPGARNVQVSFDVRGGRQVFAVDRSLEKMPWKRPYRREVFRYAKGDGVNIHYQLAGTSLHAYVFHVAENSTPSAHNGAGG